MTQEVNVLGELSLNSAAETHTRCLNPGKI